MRASDSRTGQPPKGGGLSVRDNRTVSGTNVQSAAASSALSAKPPKELRRRLKAGKTPAEGIAELIVEGVAANALVAEMFSSCLPVSDTTEAFAQTLTLVRNVSSGNRSGLEAILTAQVVACNAMFTDLVKRAQQNVPNLDITERLMRLGLKAQSQCRATVESLALMQNP